MQGSYCRANASQYLTATWVPYVDNSTGTTGVPQKNSIKNHHDGNNPSTQQSTPKKPICNLTTWESNVLLVGKDKEGAKMPKNGASMWCRAWHQVVECSNERSVTYDTSRKKINTTINTKKTICNLTTWESNVLLVGKDKEGAKMPKNGASMWCRAWHQVVECSNERSVTYDTSRKKITYGST